MKSELNEHFGMCEDFAVFEYEDGKAGEIRFIYNDSSITDGKTNDEFLAGNGVKIVLAGHIGPHMLEGLLESGIRVFNGAVGTLQDVIEDYKAGMLTEVRDSG